MMNICLTYDKHIFSKFRHEDGMYFNVRMRQEKLKREEYSKSRSENRKKKAKKNNISKTYVQHMENENENTLLTIIEWIEKYSLDFKWLADVGKSLSISQPIVLKHLSNFKNHLATQKIDKKTERDFRDHFVNWARKQKGNNNSSSGYVSPVFGN